MNKSYTGYLHLFVLVAFAFAQPIYDLLGKNPEFFIAHSAKSNLIIYMVLILSIGLALVFTIVELFARLFGERYRMIVHWLFVFSLTVLIALPLIKRMTSSDILIIGSAVILGLSSTLLYARLKTIRLFVTVLLPAAAVFPTLFLWTTPIYSLLTTQTIDTNAASEIKDAKPIVVVVFDELTTSALLDNKSLIDSERFPNFSALSSESWWFPNAVAPYFTTNQSVPSILTGLNAHPELNLIPTARNFPHNIFTLLQKHYQFNVFEPLTEICPEVLCRQEANANSQRQFSKFTADIIAIYLHMIAPPTYERKLPQFGAQWAGFGEFLINRYKPEDASPSIFRLKGWEKRDLQIERFLSRIETTANPALHFFHVLLPHVPYEFLSSGHKYNPSPNYPFPDGLTKKNENWIWTGEASLIITSYHQYIQQIGYADQFLGRLIKKLKLAGIYEEAIIIVTSDHGVSFQHGSPQRRIDKRNSRDILKVPMLVKLPGQREGYISDKLVSGVDVLPTIIEVLGAKGNWVMEGRSMLSGNELPRTTIKIPGIRVFKKNDIKGFPRLEWQVQYFDTNTLLDRLSQKGPYSELIGQKINILNIGEMSVMQLKSDELEYFKHVELNSKFLPALFRASIEGTDNRKLPLAIVLNGMVWCTTETSEWGGYPNYFSVLLPPAAFKNGRNLVEVYLVKKKGYTFLLSPIMKEGKYKIKFRTLQSGKVFLNFQDGREVQIDTGRTNMDGYLDWLTLTEDMMVFEGWAADLVDYQPASNILIFKGDNIVWQVEPAYKRAGVVKAFKMPTLLRSGYRAIVPLKVLESYGGDISIIALSKEKRAFRIHIKDVHKELISKAIAN